MELICGLRWVKRGKIKEGHAAVLQMCIRKTVDEPGNFGTVEVWVDVPMCNEETGQIIR
jgi:hypothetical protein